MTGLVVKLLKCVSDISTSDVVKVHIGSLSGIMCAPPAQLGLQVVDWACARILASDDTQDAVLDAGKAGRFDSICCHLAVY